MHMRSMVADRPTGGCRLWSVRSVHDVLRPKYPSLNRHSVVDELLLFQVDGIDGTPGLDIGEHKQALPR